MVEVKKKKANRLNRLARIVEAMEFNRNDMARALGITAAQFSRIMSGERPATAGHLALARLTLKTRIRRLEKLAGMKRL